MSGDYSQQDISNALRNVGIIPGDDIFVHSNLGFFGVLNGASSASDYYRSFKEAIFDVITEEGSLIVPTFSYSFCWGKIFDPAETPGITGMFSEMVRKDPEAKRSEDANFSVAVVGKRAAYYTENTPENVYGQDGFFKRFYDRNGKIVNFNFDAASTFIHFVERELKVPYRYDKAFKGTLIRGGDKIESVNYHYVYSPEKPDTAPEFTKFDRIAKEKSYARTSDLGRGQIVCISARDTSDLIKNEIMTEPDLLTIKGADRGARS